jgi:hypothetical protein
MFVHSKSGSADASNPSRRDVMAATFRDEETDFLVLESGAADLTVALVPAIEGSAGYLYQIVYIFVLP